MDKLSIPDLYYYCQYIKNHLNGTGDTSAEKAHVYLDRLRRFIVNHDMKQVREEKEHLCPVCGIFACVCRDDPH